MSLSDDNKEKMRQYNLKRSTMFEIVLHFPLDSQFNCTVDWLRASGYLYQFKYYACIVHDSDIYETGEIKPKHIHLIVITPVRTIDTSLKDKLLKYFDGYFPPELVDVHKINNIFKATRYLLHLDDTDKHKYKIEQICSSNRSVLFQYLFPNETTITRIIVNKINSCNGNYAFLINDLGLELTKKYHNIIYMYFLYKGWIYNGKK